MQKIDRVRRPFLIRLSLMSLFRKQAFVPLFILLIAFMLSMPSVLFSTVDNYLKAAESNKLNSFGGFSDIYYEETLLDGNPLEWQEAFEDKVKGYSYRKAGLMIRLFEKEENEEYIPGYADDSFYELGRVRLIEGNRPLAANEVMLTKSLAERKNLALGDTVSVFNENYTVSGIIMDYGRLWIRGETQVRNNRVFPNLLLSEAGMKKLNLAMPLPYERTILFLKESPDTLATAFPEDAFFYNQNISMKNDNKSYGIPNYYGYILILAIWVVQCILFRIFLMLREKTYRIFSLQGLSQKRLGVLKAFELLLIWFLSLLISIPFMLLFSYLCYALIANLGHFSYPYHPAWPIMMKWYLGSAVTGLAASVLCLCVEYFKKRHRPKSKIFHVPFRNVFQQVRWDIKLSPLSFWGLVFALLLFSGLFLANAKLATNYESQSPKLKNQLPGFLPMDYDYEFLIDGTKMGNTQQTDDLLVSVGKDVENPISFYQDQFNFGADEDLVESIKSLDGVSEVEPYRLITMSEVVLGESEDEWTEKIMEQTVPIFYDSESASRYGFEPSYKTMRSDLYGFPADKLRQLLEDYKIEEQVIESILQGEKALIIAPSFEFVEKEEEEGGKTTYYHFTTDPSKQILEYSSHKAGDLLQVRGIKTQEKFWGQVDDATFRKYFQTFHFDIPIGAIIREPVRFDTPVIEAGQLKIVLVNEALDQYGLAVPYNRIRIGLKPGADGEKVDAELLDLSLNNPVMPLNNLRLAMQDYHVYELFLRFFLTVLNLMLFVIVTTIILSIEDSKLTRNKRDYILFRLNGMSLRRFSKIRTVYYLKALGVNLCAIVLVLSTRQFIQNRISGVVDVFSGSQQNIFSWVPTYQSLALYFLFILILMAMLIVSSTYKLNKFGLKPGRL
jgi:hypothetical protein